jgi:hypothetical protein
VGEFESKWLNFPELSGDSGSKSSKTPFETFATAIVEGSGEKKVGDGQLPPLDRPPATREELARLIDYLGDPVAFAAWLERLMQQDG